MSPIAIASVVVTLSLSACVINGGDADEDMKPGPGPGSGSGSGSGSGDTGSIVPRTGHWHYADVTPISSTCAAEDDGVAGSFVIDTATAAGFHVIPGDSTDPFSCALTGNAFDCPDRALRIEDLRPGVDAVFTAHATAEGQFSSTTRGTGSQQATVTCSGTACSSAGTFPCTFEVGFTIATL